MSNITEHGVFTLRGGPWEGEEIPNIGQKETIPMPVRDHARGMVGIAVYEIEGDQAFFLVTRWSGRNPE